MYYPTVRVVSRLTGNVHDFRHDTLYSARQTAKTLNRQAVPGECVSYRAAFVVRLNEDGKTLRAVLEECKAKPFLTVLEECRT
jgi:hypothetical protein